ncbi:hypothetical protein HMPREF9018_0924 [Prevotella amnii CRIS 21A-A]|uniref:Uncharacterized protein n=1 Tax=Prevotella amnii CRIS 21A-A TaxID=679191 RepID=E1GVT7_9BACT|nr:hypothetical protein HMPREF9018_0924 [Prevotella amnii CRIS 21A-A]
MGFKLIPSVVFQINLFLGLRKSKCRFRVCIIVDFSMQRKN